MMMLRRVVTPGLVMLLAGCGGGEGAPQVFAPLRYDYLQPIRLNVAALDVEDHAVTQGDDVAASAPVPPAQALTQMAHDRIFPGGGAGRAVFVIQDAAIHRRGDTLAGSLAVRLDIVGANGRAEAFAEARVARSSTTGEGDLRTREYALTRQMMADMNVELEFQARRALKAWLQPEGDVPAAVVAQPLGGAGAPAGAATGGAAVAAPGYGAGPARGAEAAGGGGRTMSPPPGSLALPPGTPGAASPGGGAMSGASPYPQGFAPPVAPPPSFQAPGGYPAPAGASPYAQPSYGQAPYGQMPSGAPGDGAPAYGTQGYAAPAYGAQGYGAPAYGAPAYGGPPSGAPAYGSPAYGSPAAAAPPYGATPYAAPPYGAPSTGAPAYGAPAYGAPSYAPPPGLQSGPLPLTE